MRLDVLIASRGLLQSRAAAKAAILHGNVFIDGKCVKKPSVVIDENAVINIRGEADKYVGRGGYKLEHALDFFGIDTCNSVCLDLGASTGGFTDCLLQHGAALVYAVDVGHGQLDKRLCDDSRVVNIEGVNARELTSEMFQLKPDFASVDVSFISLANVLPGLRGILLQRFDVVCLIKPQFEAGRGNVGKNGVVRDEKTHIRVLEDFIDYANANNYAVRGITHSPLRGGSGNLEFLAHLKNDCDEKINTCEIVKYAHADTK